MWVIEKEAGIRDNRFGEGDSNPLWVPLFWSEHPQLMMTGDVREARRISLTLTMHHCLRSITSSVTELLYRGTITHLSQAVTLQPRVAACLVVCLVRTVMLSTPWCSLCSPFHVMTSILRATSRDAAGPASSPQRWHGKHSCSSYKPPQSPIKKQRRLPQTLRMAH